MHILCVGSTPEGPGRIAEDIVNYACQNERVTVLGLTNSHFKDSNKILSDSGAKIITLSKKRGFDFRTYKDFSSRVQKLSPDVVISLDFASNLYTYLALRKSNVPWIPSIHSLFASFTRPKIVIGRFIYKKAVRVVVPSNAVGDKCLSKRLFDSHLLKVIHNGTQYDVRQVRPNKTVSEVKKPISIGCIAGFPVPEKGQEFAVHAMKHLPENVHLTFIGDGPLRPNIMDLTRKEGLDNRIGFTGSLSYEKTMEMMSTFHLLVVPSTAEPFGKVVIEAMSAYTPVVATKAGGIPEIISDMHNGVLVPPRNPLALARGIKKVLYNDGLSEKLIETGRITVEQRFTLQRMGNEYNNLFTQYKDANVKVP